jgi:hypothetical protein
MSAETKLQINAGRLQHKRPAHATPVFLACSRVQLRVCRSLLNSIAALLDFAEVSPLLFVKSSSEIASESALSTSGPVFQACTPELLSTCDSVLYLNGGTALTF